SACAGYWNRHERSQRTLVGEWVRTGDKYRQDAAGCFWYAGRSDDMIKAGGMWVSPAEVESALAEHPAVVEAGVVGAADADELVKPLAFVVLAAGHVASPALEEELQAFVKQRLAVQVPALDRVRERAAEDGDGEDPTLSATGNSRTDAQDQQRLDAQTHGGERSLLQQQQ